MVPEIWIATDRVFVILDCFLAFYPPKDPENQNFEKIKKITPEDVIILHRCTINDNHMMYGSWDIERDGQNFLSFWTIFALLPLEQPEKSKFWKNKKKLGDIVILHMCTINDNHMMHGSWDMETDEKNVLSFWTIFCSFTPLTTWKINILKKWKKHMAIWSFYTGVPEMTII